MRFKPHTLTIVATLCLFGFASCPTKAQMFVEQEPNDTRILANQLPGGESINIQGELMLGDVDVFKAYILPGPSGSVEVAYDKFWGGYNPSGQFNRWFMTLFSHESRLFSGGTGQATMTGSSSHGRGEGAGYYYFTIFSTTPSPVSNSVVPSQVPGEYRITNLRGLNGTRILGAPVPEPSGLAFLIGMGILSIKSVVKRRKWFTLFMFPKVGHL